MSKKQKLKWKQVDWLFCDCGADPWVHSEIEGPELVGDCEQVKCRACGANGFTNVKDYDEVTVAWEEVEE